MKRLWSVFVLLSVIISPLSAQFDSLQICPADTDEHYCRSYADAICSGDFDKDGREDIAVGYCCFGGEITDLLVLSGDGKGHFREIENQRIAATISTVVCADVNEDDTLDLIMGDYVRNNIYVYFGHAGGHFTLSSTFTSPGGPHAIAIADFNLDHHVDFVVTCCWEDSMRIFLGNGKGAFVSGHTYHEISFAHPACADFNNDTIPDIALISDRRSTVINILSGKGDGTFGKTKKSTGIGYDWWSMSAADFNKDGKADLVIADKYTVVVLINNGKNKFIPSTYYKVAYPGMLTIITADLNEDKNPEIIRMSDSPCLVIMCCAPPRRYDFDFNKKPDNVMYGSSSGDK